MNEEVWISDILADPEVTLSVTNDLLQRDEVAFIEGENLLKKGLPVPEHLCPKRIWGSQDSDAPKLKSVPDLFGANGQFFVSEKAANILRQFDMDGGALYPVSEGVYQNDNNTLIPGEFFCWIFGNSKQAFLPDETPEKRPFGVAGLRWSMPINPKDGAVAVSTAALVCPDVWMDPTLFKSVFVSGPLGQALFDAGLSKAFRLFRCKVI